MILAIAVSTFLHSALASASPHFAKLETDQSSYLVGSKGIILAKVERLPENPDMEFHLSFLLQNEKVNVVQLSNSLAVALPKRFDTAGEFDMELQVLEQNKKNQQELGIAAAYYSSEIDRLKKEYDAEIDPEARTLIQQRINFDLTRIDALNARMEEQRILLEIDHAPVVVEVAAKNASALATFTAQADRNPATYSEGERATFTFHPNTDFSGPHGPRENVFSAKIDGQTLGQAVASGMNYVISTSAFTSAGIGNHMLQATFSIRSKKQADLLRDANTQAAKKVQDFTALRDKAASPAEHAYYDYKINELNGVIAAINEQLTAILLDVGSTTIPFSVTN